MHQNPLTNIGLTEKEAHVYEILLKSGPVTILSLTKRAPYKRSDLYNILNGLTGWGLVEVEKVGKKKTYVAVHPAKLEDFARDQEHQVKQNKKILTDMLPELTSLYRIGHNKPGVRYFEGIDGVKEALNHSLEARGQIYTFINNGAVKKHPLGKEIDKAYVAGRVKRGIEKKIIMVDNPEGKEYIKELNPPLTEIRFLNEDQYPFDNIAIEIYNNSVLYISSSDTLVMAFLLEDPAIARFHKSTFLFIWNILGALRRR